MLGYIRDEPDERDLIFGSAPSELPPPADLGDLIFEVFDQGHSSSCVANALVSAIAMREVDRGGEWNPVSRLFVYRAAALALERGFGDGGCRPRDALRALKRIGAPREKAWPFEFPANFETSPPWSVRRSAVDLRFAYERCSTADDIRRALANRSPVAVGLSIDRAFFDSERPSVITDIDQSNLVGGHMMLIIGESSDRRRFTLLNSWGPEWRSGGFVQITADLVERRAYDLWAIS